MLECPTCCPVANTGPHVGLRAEPLGAALCCPWGGSVNTVWDRPLNCRTLQSHSQPEEEEGEDEEEAEELGHAETYADYVPSKCECPSQGRHGDTH